jgi:hypothetical protein
MASRGRAGLFEPVVKWLRKRVAKSGAGGTPGRVRPLTRADLTPEQAANLNRYTKKLPSAAEEPTIARLPDGSVQFQTRVPGRVPGSYALYTKAIDSAGNTISYTKTTILPDGSVAHVKDKMNP